MNGIAVAADVVAVINDWVRDSFDCLRNRLYLPADSYRRRQCLRWCLGRMICLKSGTRCEGRTDEIIAHEDD